MEEQQTDTEHTPPEPHSDVVLYSCVIYPACLLPIVGIIWWQPIVQSNMCRAVEVLLAATLLPTVFMLFVASWRENRADRPLCDTDTMLRYTLWGYLVPAVFLTVALPPIGLWMALPLMLPYLMSCLVYTWLLRRRACRIARKKMMSRA